MSGHALLTRPLIILFIAQRHTLTVCDVLKLIVF